MSLLSSVHFYCRAIQYSKMTEMSMLVRSATDTNHVSVPETLNVIIVIDVVPGA